MPSRKTGAIAIVIVAILVASVTGYFYVSNTNSKQEVVNLKWGYIASTPEIPVVVNALGLSQKYGLNITFVSFTDFRLDRAAFYAGNLDIDGTIDPSQFAAQYGTGTPVIALAISRIYIPPSNIFIVPKASSINSLADLKGKNIGVSDFTAGSGMLLKEVLASKYGINITSENKVQNPNPNLVPAFVDNGQIDGGLIQSVATALKATASGKYNTIYDVAIEWRNLYGDYPGLTVLAIQKKLLDQRPDVVQKIALMYKDAVDYIAGHPTDPMFDAIAKQQGLNTTETLNLYRNSALKTYTYRIDDAMLKNVKFSLQLNLKNHLIKAIPDDGWYTTKYASIFKNPPIATPTGS